MKIAALVVLISYMYACTPLYNEVWINENGSGKVMLRVDYSKFYHLMDDFKKEVLINSENNRDSLIVSLMAREVIDTSILMHDLFPSIEGQEASDSELSKNLLVGLQKNSKSEQLVFTFSIIYDSELELESFFEQVRQGKNLNTGVPIDEQIWNTIFTRHSVDLKNGILRVPRTKEYIEMARKIANDDKQKEADSDVSVITYETQDLDLTTKFYLPGDIQFTNDSKAKIENNTVTIYENTWSSITSEEKFDSLDRIIKFEVKN